MNRMKERGFTLIELIIVVAIAIAVLAMLFSLLRGSQAHAEDEAFAHVEKLYPDHKNIIALCVDSDSDGDGYISCSVTAENKNGDRETLPPLECGSGGWHGFWKNTGGCKQLVSFSAQQR